MTNRTDPDRPPPQDRLVTRPDSAPLPTTLDPAGPEARGYPADPKPIPPEGEGDPAAKNPAPDDIGRAV